MADAVEMDQAFIEYVVKSIVDNPDAVVVSRSVDDRGVLLELTVDPDDMGKIIGKAGATAKAIRTLLRVLGAKSDARFNLKIAEPESDGAGSGISHEDSVAEEAESTQQGDEHEAEQDDRAEAIKAKAREGLEDLDDLDI